MPETAAQLCGQSSSYPNLLPLCCAPDSVLDPPGHCNSLFIGKFFQRFPLLGRHPYIESFVFVFHTGKISMDSYGKKVLIIF